MDEAGDEDEGEDVEEKMAAKEDEEEKLTYRIPDKLHRCSNEPK